MNGLDFSGDSELVLTWEKDDEDALVGDEAGVPVRMAVPGDWLFCLRNGDCLPEGDSKGESWAESLLGFDEAIFGVGSLKSGVCSAVCRQRSISYVRVVVRKQNNKCASPATAIEFKVYRLTPAGRARWGRPMACALCPVAPSLGLCT